MSGAEYVLIVSRCCSIQFEDCVWSGMDKHSRSRNIMAAIQSANELAMFVTWQVLSSDDAEDRARTIQWFIRVGILLNVKHRFCSLIARITPY